MIKVLIFLCAAVIAFDLSSAEKVINSRNKRSAYVLPSGWNQLISSVDSSFNCKSNGYFADISNNCQLYHVCESSNSPFAKKAIFRQHSFICGPGTVFNQLTLTCARAKDSIPCQSSEIYFYLNERIGDPKAYFLTSNDLERAKSVDDEERGAGGGDFALMDLPSSSVLRDTPRFVVYSARPLSSAVSDDELNLTDNKK